MSKDVPPMRTALELIRDGQIPQGMSPALFADRVLIGLSHVETSPLQCIECRTPRLCKVSGECLSELYVPRSPEDARAPKVPIDPATNDWMNAKADALASQVLRDAESGVKPSDLSRTVFVATKGLLAEILQNGGVGEVSGERP